MLLKQCDHRENVTCVTLNENAFAHIVLDRPKIAGNVGSIARLCANIGAALHICGQTPFERDRNKQLWRAGLDYWHLSQVHFHRSIQHCLHALATTKPWVIEVGSQHSLFDATFNDGDVFIFGPEDGDVDAEYLHSCGERHISLAHIQEARSLNLAQCAAVVAYEALRQSVKGSD
jgi:tRNA (cytidine/uridine-2'-O-)-methyltransferase